jgi:hypothetical protein
MKIGPVTITRDSSVLWLGAAIGVVTYLSNMPAPWQWSYAQWMQALGVALSGLSLKLQTSWIKHSTDL